LKWPEPADKAILSYRLHKNNRVLQHAGHWGGKNKL